MVKTKSIYDEKEDKDGYRVLVTRFWPRGVKKERADVWVKELGPSPGLIRQWKDGKIEWTEFKKKYLEEHRHDEKKKEAFGELKKIIKEAKGGVTLLCTCRDEMCHRVILKDMLKK